VKPEFVDEKHFILKPCVKWGVKPGSYTFENELFAPLLAVVCNDNLEHGIQLVNNSEYGLTSGLQSLDENEQARWRSSIEAGNLYINRGITGAIVNRQPFGGMKRSAFGGGIKAGGRNYVSWFVQINETEKAIKKGLHYFTEFKSFDALLVKEQKDRFLSAVESYFRNMKEEFSQQKDIYNLVGEENIFRYLPLKNMLFRVLPNDELCEIFMIVAAAKICKTKLTLSIDSGDPKIETISNCIDNECNIILQTEDEFIDSMENFERIRTCTANLSTSVYKKAATLGKYIATAKPLVEGRLELLHYLKEQSVTFEYHRYGSITPDKIN
jgi:RHH-type proline utilization regulon transcriptional repressor/proline dehydrogenase/delta 1-pyrroline-5-carboxylate dehydrogenase